MCVQDKEDWYEVAEGWDNQIAHYNVQELTFYQIEHLIEYIPDCPEAVTDDEAAHDQVNLKLHAIEYDKLVEDAQRRYQSRY